MMSSKELFKIFNIGDSITIINFDYKWSSALNPNCPDMDSIKIPHTTTILRMKYINNFEGGEHIAFTDNKFGWNLTSLVKNNCIDVKKHIRMRKIKKLNML